TKARAPDPVSTTQRTASSAAAASNAWWSASRVAAFSAFSLSGRSTVMTRTAPRSAMATGVAAWVSDMRELPRGLGGFLLEHEGATHRGTRAADRKRVV